MGAALMKAMILDHSVSLSWFVCGQQISAAMGILDEMAKLRVYVPTLWSYEFINSLYVFDSIKKINLALPVPEIIRLVRALPIETVDFSLDELLTGVYPLCVRHQLSVYEASALALCVRLGHPLATLDPKQIMACQKEKIPLLLTGQRPNFDLF